MDTLLYYVAWLLVKGLQALPLELVAQIGRAGGAIAYVIDARHRRVALRNLTMCFSSEKTPAEIKAMARENLRRLGENYCCAVKTAAMPWLELKKRVEIVAPAWLAEATPDRLPPSVVIAVGHFGNFELYARFADVNPTIRCATTYRGLRPPSLDRILRSLRERPGCRFFERRTEASALKAWMAPTGQALGLLADQHAGRGGVVAPFFGFDCATTAAPAVFALRYNNPLYVAICFRTGLARWRIEVTASVATHENGRPRAIEAITRDINREFERAVRRDPPNWFWVHNRWKPDKLAGIKRRVGDTTHQTATSAVPGPNQ